MQPVDEVGAKIRRFHRFRGELGGGNKSHYSVIGLVRPRVGGEGHPGAAGKWPV